MHWFHNHRPNHLSKHALDLSIGHYLSLHKLLIEFNGEYQQTNPKNRGILGSKRERDEIDLDKTG